VSFIVHPCSLDDKHPRRLSHNIETRSRLVFTRVNHKTTVSRNIEDQVTQIYTKRFRQDVLQHQTWHARKHVNAS